MSRLFVFLLIFLLPAVIQNATLSAQKLVVEKLGSAINSDDYDEISPVLSGDGKTLFFTRVGSPDFKKNLLLNGQDLAYSIPEKYDFYLNQVYSWIVGKKIENPEKSPFNQDIWMVKSIDLEEQNLIHPGPPVNNALPNSLCSTTPSLHEYVVINQFFPDGGMDAGFSVVRKLDDTMWTFPEPIFIEGFDVSGSSVSLTMSADGEVLIMAFGGNEGYGSHDLYASFKIDFNHFSKPVNLGSDVNSPFRETTPTLSSDKKVLYFSSNRSGNSDLYFVRRLDDSWQKWSSARKFVAPINSPSDDSQPHFNTATGYLYFTSKRDGSSDIFRVKISEPKAQNVTIKGRILNSNTKELLPASIHVYDVGQTENLYAFASPNGYFSFQVAPGQDMKILADKNGFSGVPELVFLSEEYYREELEIILLMDPLSPGAQITLNPVYFERSKPEIKEESFVELNNLVNLLNRFPDISISIEGHTDNVGPQELLKKLSEDRAQAIRQFLIKKGISGHRVIARGFGAERPLNENLTEEERAKNRRVEIRVIAGQAVEGK